LIGMVLILVLSAFEPAFSEDLIIKIEGQVKSAVFEDLNGDSLKDLIVMVSPSSQNHKVVPLQVYIQKKTGKFDLLTIPPGYYKDAAFIDVGNYGPSPGKEILFIEKDLVKVLYIDNEGKSKLYPDTVPVKALFFSKAHRFSHCLGFATDVDGNGFDDPMVPITDGYAVLLSCGDGSFKAPIAISYPVECSIQSSGNTFFSIMTLVSKLVRLKHPGELPMIILETEGNITKFQYQPDKAVFSRVKSKWAGFGSYSAEKKEGSVEYSGIFFNDYVKGAPPAFLLSHREGRTGILAGLKTTHTYYHLKEDQKNKVLEAFPMQKIVTDGISGAPVFSDLNADGYKDLALLYVKTSFLTKLLEFILDRVVITCQAHIYDPKSQRFSYAPDWSEDVSVPALSFRVVGIEGLIRLDGDYTGDGRPDMVVYDTDRLILKRGEKDSGWFSSKEISFNERPFYQIGGPFPGPILFQNVDIDPRPEIITFGKNIVRIIYVH